MLDINLEINKLLYDKNYQIRALEAFNRGDFFDVFNNEQYKGLCSIGRTKKKSGRAVKYKSKLNRK